MLDFLPIAVSLQFVVLILDIVYEPRTWYMYNVEPENVHLVWLEL
jgi:hypothetical protein